ncbi:MAG: nucleotidyl transferase AbiEii/AbiGii toxin family protein [Acidimicrobiia bacterium]|nr:nucleotidyl transferase AbiEii/AbiGii toxin family protein [Acidimicrobiia bacterium]
MPVSRLTPLQERALDVLAGMEPSWTLFGAAALIGFHLGHRVTRDLDLAFRPLSELGEIPREVEARLRRAGLRVDRVQTSLSFVRLQVTGSSETIELDLVADPIPPAEMPYEVRPGVRIDTARELLAQKLSALLSRTELRDLEDVGALLAAGGDLEQGLRDAAARDAGFSPPTLAWLLQDFPLERAPEEGRDPKHLRVVQQRLLEALRAG